jgi:serine acetyltransferase/thymidylate kinase
MQHSALLMDFFRLLDAKRIAYCVLGDTEQLPHRIASDVDIVVAESTLPRLPALLDEYCRQHRLRLVQCLQHEANAFYFVVSFKAPDNKAHFLALDFCGDYYRRGRQLLSSHELVTHAIAATYPSGLTKGFKICAPAFAFCYYLLKKIDKEQLHDGHGEHLTRQWHLDPIGCAKMIERFWGRSFETRLLMRAAESGDWTTVAKILPRMRAKLHRRVPLRPAPMWRELARHWRRWRQPTGLLIAALGPDGSGKSSAIAAADRQIREAFRQTTIVHLRPGFLYRPERAPSRTPHAEKPRGRVRSFLKLLFFTADYVLGYLFSLRPLLVRSNALLFDRYYDDVLVDPLRYRQRGSQALARRLRSFVPRPDLWLLFDAPADVLQARKQEVSFEESNRQRHAYRDLLHDQANVTVIDASQPLDTVISNTTDAILARCESRTRSRLGLHKSGHRSPLGARWLLFCCRHRIPLISKLARIIFNSDIYCRVPRDLYLPHPYGIVIHSHTRLGRNVTVMQQVTLGGKDLEFNVAPTIGDGAYIGAGARVLGAVTIGADAIIGANAVVTRDVPAGAKVVGANRILERSARKHSVPVVAAIAESEGSVVAIDGNAVSRTTGGAAR